MKNQALKKTAENVTRSNLKKKSRIWTTFSIAGFDSPPALVTKALRTRPTKTHARGDYMPNTRSKYKKNYWSLSIRQGDHVQMQIQVLLQKLKYFNFHSQMFRRSNPSITVVLELAGSDTTPTLNLTNDQLRKITELGIEFGVTYNFRGHIYQQKK